MSQQNEPRKAWTRRGDGWTCPPWDIGPKFEEDSTLWVLWREGTAAPVGYFEDPSDAMTKARELERA